MMTRTKAIVVGIIGIALVSVAAGLWIRSKSMKNATPPPFLAWVEISRDPKHKGDLDAYPLIAVKGGSLVDISLDPEAEKAPLPSIPVERFPLKAKPVVSGFFMGKELGLLRIKSYKPVQVACNELVLGKGEWAEKGNRTSVPRGIKGFIAAFQLPKQRSWASTLPTSRRQEIEAKFLAEARTKFDLAQDVNAKEFLRNWISLGESRGDVAFFEVLWKVGEELKVLNALVQVQAQGDAKTIWEVSGQGAAESDAGIPVYEFLDAFDVDGDGIPELVLGYHNYEANSFILIRILPGKPTELWNGSGYGC
ncbi:hypothetical protein METESE_33720 [Mesoterricola sediminis]|uniref:Uncharacterized protein n=2 Tax=Mesoterricola sediminis TaxID=2927980 RepID=A0AA48GV78_9BACT|nr:hypothetical protein METESE_33720 [Mesoterricola sediminis]